MRKEQQRGEGRGRKLAYLKEKPSGLKKIKR